MLTPGATEPQNRRPHPNLLKYYVLESFLLGPLFPIVLLPRFFRYRTLNYHWDEQGITARWGILFRREISLDFERIQDIHLSSNLVERWLGLAKVQVQTASGSSKAEMTVEGLQDFKEVRDFLYARMRGVRAPEAKERDERASNREVIRALQETAAELRALRLELEARRTGATGGDSPTQPASRAES